jgi:hypothetical protein
MGSTETLVNVMRGMAKMMGKANASMNVVSVEQAMAMFQKESEKGNMIGEMMEDAMNMGEDAIEDEDADKLITSMEMGNKVPTSVNKQYQSTSSLEAYQTRLQRLG